VPLFGRRSGTRLFYAADIHGSEPTWRKFVNAAAFYGADVLVFGGDLMGKALAPIVRRNGHLVAEVEGRAHELDGDAELRAFAKTLEATGFYWSVLEPDEHDEMRRDPLLAEGMVQDLARERLRRWLEFAGERLAGSEVRLFVTGGNDDPDAVLSVLDEFDGDRVVASEGRVVELDGDHTMITLGVSTPTPWDTAREMSEEEIESTIDRDVARVPDVSRCVFNLHVPPKDTALDRCLKVEVVPGQLPKPVREAGRFVTTGGGSVAVREALGRYQPVAGLHGHIHESAGRIRLGRTHAFNPGSEYAQGHLEGVLVTLRSGEVVSYQHTSG
jgi:Icc-related predicted phosphoesterase